MAKWYCRKSGFAVKSGLNRHHLPDTAGELIAFLTKNGTGMTKIASELGLFMSKARYQADVVIIGGGPAGLSAAAWCSELGLSALLVERECDIGGQLHHIHGPIENYIGLRANNGQEMVEHFRTTVRQVEFVRLMEKTVTSIELESRVVALDGGFKIKFDCLIIATGVRRRRLGIPGEAEFRGKGILESGVRDASLAAGKNVVLVGGGDAAAENALILSDVASSVKVVHRRSRMTARDEFLREMNERNNIEVVFDTELTGIYGNSQLSSVRLRSTTSDAVRTEPADAVLIRVGVKPNSELVAGILDLDDRGYIRVNAECETTAEGVFAAGDVAHPVSPTLSAAAGMGSTAAKSAFILITTKENGI